MACVPSHSFHLLESLSLWQFTRILQMQVKHVTYYYDNASIALRLRPTHIMCIQVEKYLGDAPMFSVPIQILIVS